MDLAVYSDPLDLDSVPVTYVEIPDGDAGGRATARQMAAMIAEDRDLLAIQGLAIEITQGIDWTDTWGLLEALHAWVRDTVEYRKDPAGIETVRGAALTLRLGAGDCDDQAILLGALVAAIDAAPLAVTLAKLGPREDFSHVLVSAQLDGRWVPMEAIVPGIPLGELPPGTREVEHLPVDLGAPGLDRLACNPPMTIEQALGRVGDELQLTERERLELEGEMAARLRQGWQVPTQPRPYASLGAASGERAPECVSTTAFLVLSLVSTLIGVIGLFRG